MIAVTDAPPGAELGGGARDPVAARRDERRHRRDVIRVGRVTKAEQDRDEEDDADRGSVGETCDPVVEPEHVVLFVRPTRSVRLDDAGKRANRDDEADGEDERGADGREGTHERAVERQPSERPTREYGDEADRGDRRGEPEAEGDDERQSETDPVERDRREEDDERRRARQEPGCDPDAEDPLRRSAPRRGRDGGA